MTARIDALVARFALMSRREATQAVRSGRVRVNERVPRTADAHVEEGERVYLDGAPLDTRADRHILLHKPVGVLTAARDARAVTVMSLLPPVCTPIGCMPVGRLDKDTSGVLLFTTDGELAHRLLSPARGVNKTYLARVQGRLTDQDADAFAAGLVLHDFTARPARLEIIQANEESSLARVTVHEGRYHQVRRMLGARGHEVISLERLSFGPLMLDDLAPGAWRELTQEEYAALKACAEGAQA